VGGLFFEQGQGGFGSDSPDRADLPPVARARAGRADGAGSPWPRERTVVIGDTPRDIACARADGVRVVAVPTGPFAAAELAGADVLIGSLHELPEALAGL
jgi:phosphoglycolate phosphatase-like HAD superfamily hydrolase